MLKQFQILTILLFLSAACGPVTPVVDDPISIATMKAAAESGFLEPLTPENFDRLQQVARFGNGTIQDVAVAADQSTLAVYVGENIYIYDAETFDLEKSITAGKYIKNSIAAHRDNWKIMTFTSDGKSLIFSDGQGIVFWDMDSNERLTSFASLIPDWDIVDIALSPAEDRIMVTTMGGSRRCEGRDMNFSLYDLDGRLIFDRYACADYSNNFYRFTNDGKVMFVLASTMTGIYPTQTILLDAVSGEILSETHAEYLDYEQPISNLELLYDVSPDGKILAYAIYNMVDENLNIRTKLVDFETKNIIHEQDGYLGYSVDQDIVSWRTTSVNTFPAQPEVKICNINNSHQLDVYKLLLTNQEQAVFAMTHFGQIHSLELWDILTCKIKKTISYPSANEAVFSADGQWLASTDGFHAYVWDVQSGKLHFMVDGKAFESPKDVIRFNADGSRLLAGPYGRDYIGPDHPYQTYTISIFDIKTGKLIKELKPNGSFLKNIIATPEKDLILIQDSTGQYVWDIETGQELATLPDGPSVFAREAGHLWIAPRQDVEDQTLHKIILYNYRTGEQVHELGEVLTHWVRNIHLDGSGTRLLAHLFLGQGKDNGDAVVIFDTENSEIKPLFYKLPWGNYEMSAYGDYFATNDSDGYAHLWNYESDAPILTLWGNHRNWKVSDQYKDAEDKNDVYAMLANTNWIDVSFFDEQILITQSDALRFWDTKSGYLLAEMKPDYSIVSLSINPAHTLIAVMGSDGIIRLWGVPNKP